MLFMHTLDTILLTFTLTETSFGRVAETLPAITKLSSRLPVRRDVWLRRAVESVCPLRSGALTMAKTLLLPAVHLILIAEDSSPEWYESRLPSSLNTKIWTLLILVSPASSNAAFVVMFRPAPLSRLTVSTYFPSLISTVSLTASPQAVPACIAMAANAVLAIVPIVLFIVSVF